MALYLLAARVEWRWNWCGGMQKDWESQKRHQLLFAFVFVCVLTRTSSGKANSFQNIYDPPVSCPFAVAACLQQDLAFWMLVGRTRTDKHVRWCLTSGKEFRILRRYNIRYLEVDSYFLFRHIFISTLNRSWGKCLVQVTDTSGPGT